MTLIVSELALRDLEFVQDYTLEVWNREVWKRYRAKLDQAFIAIRSGRDPGRPFHLPSRTLRRVLVGKHHIYFERSADLLFVSRVLHGAMNVYLLEFPLPSTADTNE